MSITRARRAPPAAAIRPVPPPARAPQVIVVTHDAELECALRAASPSTSMMIATTPAALADLLMTGRAGALVLDLGALDSAALTVARHLAEQFPDVPLVAVGFREDEARLAGLISRGLIYRFLHRPVSAARARTFIEAALRRSAEFAAGQRSPPAPAAKRTATRSHPLLALAAAGATAALALGFWLALRPPPTSPSAAPRQVVAIAVAPAAEAAPVAAAVPPTPTPATTIETLTQPAPAAVARALTSFPSSEAAPRAEPAAPDSALPPVTLAVTAEEARGSGAQTAADAAPPASAAPTPAEAAASAAPEPQAAERTPPDGG